MKPTATTFFPKRPWDGSNYALLATPAEMSLPNRIVLWAQTHDVQLIGELVQMTQAELLETPNLGRKSLAETERVLAQHGLRFGMFLQEWETAAALEERARLGRSLLRQLAARTGPATSPTESLEAELQGLIASVESGRNVALLVSLYGFDGSEPKTLEAVGQVYGLTRERVRQIGDRARVRLSSRWHDTPHLAAATEYIKKIAPAGRPAIAAELEKRGITKGYFSPDAILEAAELIDLDTKIRRLAIGENVLFGLGQSRSLIRLCLHNLRKSTSKSGCTSVERLALEADLPIGEASKVRGILDALSETIWLDDSKTWVLSNRPTRNRLVNVACKVFAVAQKVEIGELRRAMSRPHRVPYVPPAEALSRLLEFTGAARRCGDLLVHEHSTCPTKLSGIEEILLDGFRTLGSPLSREALEQYCIEEHGINPTSFYIYLSYSPIVAKLMPGVYALVGTEVSAGSAERIRTAQLEARRSPEHGWTPAGRLWLMIPLDRLVINAMSRAVPTYVAELAAGTWACSVPGSLSAGEISIQNGFLSGLRGAFTLLAPEPGDFLFLTFDLQTRHVDASVGGPDLKEAAVQTIPIALEDDEADDQDDVDFEEVDEIEFGHRR